MNPSKSSVEEDSRREWRVAGRGSIERVPLARGDRREFISEPDFFVYVKSHAPRDPRIGIGMMDTNR